MSLKIASLNSGSNGNCYYIGNEQEAVLIDAGISCKEVEKRMKRLQLPIAQVKAIFITHEHADHINGVSKLSKKYKLPVYITPLTLQQSAVTIEQDLAFSFSAYEPIIIGQLKITAFPKYHDAVDPHSFIVANEKVKVGVFTDIGYACRHVIHHFKQCHAVFVESNYDTEMLMSGPYPPALQNRIRGGYGHLSNMQALKLFNEHRPAYMSHLILSHLSRNNNKTSIVEDLFKNVGSDTQVIIASRDQETEVFTISATGKEPIQEPRMVIEFGKQLKLF